MSEYQSADFLQGFLFPNSEMSKNNLDVLSESATGLEGCLQNIGNTLQIPFPLSETYCKYYGSLPKDGDSCYLHQVSDNLVVSVKSSNDTINYYNSEFLFKYNKIENLLKSKKTNIDVDKRDTLKKIIYTIDNSGEPDYIYFIFENSIARKDVQGKKVILENIEKRNCTENFAIIEVGENKSTQFKKVDAYGKIIDVTENAYESTFIKKVKGKIINVNGVAYLEDVLTKYICCEENTTNNTEDQQSGGKKLSVICETGCTTALTENNIDYYYFDNTVYGCEEKNGKYEIKEEWTEAASPEDILKCLSKEATTRAVELATIGWYAFFDKQTKGKAEIVQDKKIFNVGTKVDVVSTESQKATILNPKKEYLPEEVAFTINFYIHGKKASKQPRQTEYKNNAYNFFNYTVKNKFRNYLDVKPRLTYLLNTSNKVDKTSNLKPYAKLYVGYTQENLNAIGLSDMAKAFKSRYSDYKYRETAQDPNVSWAEGDGNSIIVSQGFVDKFFDSDGTLKEFKVKIQASEYDKLYNYKVNQSIDYVYNELCCIIKRQYERADALTEKQKPTYFLNTYFQNMTLSEFYMLVGLSMMLNSIENSALFEELEKKVKDCLAGVNKDEQGNKISDKELNLKGFIDSKITSLNKTQLLEIEDDRYKSAVPLKSTLYSKDDQGDYNYYIYSFRCILTRRCLLYSLTTDPKPGKRLATLIASNDDATFADDNSTKEAEMGLQQVEDFIQTWMVKGKVENVTEQVEIPVENYYDMYSNMTPYVKIGFRDAFACVKEEQGDIIYSDGVAIAKREKGEDKYIYKKITGVDSNGKYKISSEQLDDKQALNLLSNCFTWIDSINYPYISSVSIEDTGVKQLNLTLIDPDFASYQMHPVKSNGKIFSLESLLRGALIQPTSSPKQTTEHYENNDFSDNYLKLDNQIKASPTNLKLRFGYANYNQEVRTNVNNTGANEETLDHYGRSNGGGRVGRWWDEKEFGDDNYIGVEQIKKYVVKDSDEIKGNTGTWNAIAGNEDFDDADGTLVSKNASETSQIVNDQNTSLKHMQLVNSKHQTTSMSRMLDFMITGFSTEFTTQGIKYNIKAIESKDGVLCTTRFLQRYAEITSYPEEVLYILMHMFNETNDGKNITTSNVKICLMEDEDELVAMNDKLNQRYDKKKLSDEQFKDADGTDTYSIALSDSQFNIPVDALENITLSLGGNEATRNYKEDAHVPLYKTVSELINDFCAACPPKQKKQRNLDSYDANGNKVVASEEMSPSRPLKWFTSYDHKNDIIYICLYYRKTQKIPKIRVYTWGPHNPTISCVKNISIQNSNEFAVLSGIKSFDGKDYMARNSRDLVETTVECNTNQTEDAFLNDQVSDAVNVVGVTSDSYDAAFANSMYTGSIEILGDPFYTFDGKIQPCTYPIKLNVLIPQNTMTQKRQNKNMLNLEEVFGKRDIYNGSYSLNQTNTNGNQRLHEMSGYYVVKKITHNLSSSGFTTKLEVMSYPNIQKDVLL